MFRLPRSWSFGRSVYRFPHILWRTVLLTWLYYGFESYSILTLSSRHVQNWPNHFFHLKLNNKVLLQIETTSRTPSVKKHHVWHCGATKKTSESEKVPAWILDDVYIEHRLFFSNRKKQKEKVWLVFKNENALLDTYYHFKRLVFKLWRFLL